MAESRRTSLKDLAQILGVSIPTRIRALKNSPEISRELCIKAQKLAKEMNYHPNPFAMSLRKNTPRTIGVIVPDIVTHFLCVYFKWYRRYRYSKRLFCYHHDFP